MNTFTNDKFARSNFFATHIFAAMLASSYHTNHELKDLITLDWVNIEIGDIVSGFQFF